MSIARKCPRPLVCSRIKRHILQGGLLIVVSLIAAGPARATNYDDGGTHTISGPDTDVVISNGTTVNITPGAIVTPALQYDPIGGDAVVVSNGVLVITGGSMTGGDSRIGGDGVRGYGSFDISGGTLQGGHGSSFRAGAGAELAGQITISGGNFYGGNGDFAFGALGGDGLSIGSSTPAIATISGGTFLAGGGAGPVAFDLHATGMITVNISGGNFLGAHTGFADNSVGNLSGGSSSARMESYNQAVLHVTNGQFSGGFGLHDSSVVDASGGALGGFEVHDMAVANLDGATISGDSFLYDSSITNLRGGYLYAPEGFMMYQSSVLNVFGTGLTLQDLGPSFIPGAVMWELQGTLQDGSPIDAFLFRFGSDTVVNLHQVPEPSTVVLAFLALIGLCVFAWQRRSAERALRYT